jgi:VWFA-related protein
MTPRRVVLSLLFLLGTFSLLADTHREMTTVEVVQVPVYVSVDGKAVGGLTRGDFDVYINGKRQEVDYFDVIDFAQQPATATVAADPRQRRMYLFAFDMLFSSLNSLNRAQKAAEGYLEHALPGDVFAVARYTSNHGLELIVPFTRDRKLVFTALRLMSTKYAGDPLQLTISRSPQPLMDPEHDFGGSGLPGVYGRQQAARELALEPGRYVVQDQIRALTEVADRMALLDGQKHVVWFSSGFDDGYVHGVWAAQRRYFTPIQLGPVPSLTRYGAYGVFNEDMFTDSPPPRIGGDLRKLAQHYTAAGVFLDAIDIAGIRPGQTAADNESLFTLTRDTGGTVVEHENNLSTAIQSLADQQRVVYVLGFKPPAGTNKANSIRVEVRNAPRGADVTYRPSFAREVPLPSSNDGLRLADILANDMPQTGLNLTATTTVAPGHAVVDIDIATREMLALSEGKNIEAEALMYVYSGNAVVAFQQKRITLEAGKVDPSKPVRLSQTFDLPNGSYAAKVLVRYDDQLGFARSDFVVGQ